LYASVARLGERECRSGRDDDDLVAVVKDLGANGQGKAGRSGEPITDEVVALAIYLEPGREHTLTFVRG
jgi:hypothetical protein